ncbi:cadherin-related family member 5 [Varanus komodoensis]|uniref:cadherin-related family member 5 n=1 Tax=Varanus komodoensis TaxID=61221 RepID=UPI001CF7DA1E|nr:cadherin-related family member 5 [Varanus komodoensis]
MAVCSVQNDMFSIEENNPPGMVITNVRAAAGVTVTVDPQPGTDFHWFEMKDLQLILKYSVDYENTTVLLVFLKCTGAGMIETVLNIVVTIVNVNDNPPVFSHTNMTVRVNEDTKVNTVIVPQANVTATDADLDVIYYSLTGNPTVATAYFNIQGVNNPQISLRRALDYEQINFMVLTLHAMDGTASAVGTHTATATISIYILQADLRPPWFQPCTFIGGTNTVCLSHGYRGKINISEMATEPLILEPGPLYAIDGDKTLNEKIVYEMAGGVLTSRMYTVQDMTALGVTLGCLLAVALVLLGLVSYRYYKMKRSSCKFEGFVNTNFQNDEKFDSVGKGSLLSASIAAMSSFPDTLAPLGKSPAERAFDAILEKAEKDEETDSSKEVRSILTKDRRMSDNGYKAVWFKEDIDPEAKDDVLVIEDDNDVEPHMSNAVEDDNSDQDSESSGDGGGMHITPGEAQLQGADPPAIQLFWDMEARSVDL